MKSIINIILGLLVIALVYVLINNIKEPIIFKAQKEARNGAVVEKLKKIRTAQEAYYGIKGKFASSFDSLEQTLKNDNFTIVNVFGNADDINNTTMEYDTTLVSARDSMATLNINLDSLRFVPYNGGEFEVTADTLTYQKVLVNTVEVKVQIKNYMGPYKDDKYRKYDQTYDPEGYMKFGDMEKPSLGGNWE